MSTPPQPRRTRLPFILALAFIAIVSLAVFRLTDAFVVQLRNNSPLSDESAGWAYRLIAIISFVQALYAGWAILRPERVQRAMTDEASVAQMPRRAIAAGSVRGRAASMNACTSAPPLVHLRANNRDTRAPLSLAIFAAASLRPPRLRWLGPRWLGIFKLTSLRPPILRSLGLRCSSLTYSPVRSTPRALPSPRSGALDIDATYAKVH